MIISYEDAIDHINSIKSGFLPKTMKIRDPEGETLIVCLWEHEENDVKHYDFLHGTFTREGFTFLGKIEDPAKWVYEHRDLVNAWLFYLRCCGGTADSVVRIRGDCLEFLKIKGERK